MLGVQLLKGIVSSAVGLAVPAYAKDGFATFAGRPVVEPEIAWAKLGAMVEGARLASRELGR